MECQAMVPFVCSQKHRSQRPCFKSQAACAICAEEDRQRERIRKRNAHLDAERDAKRAAYALQLAENQAEMNHQRRILQDHREDEDSARVLEQKKQDLANLKVTANNLKQQRQSCTKPHATPASKSSGKKVAEENEEDWSTAKKQWEHFKRYEGADNEALDDLMGMIGLEDVKDKFLAIKLEVDTAVRQGLDMSNKRFGASLLGNPGTGKQLLFLSVIIIELNY